MEKINCIILSSSPATEFVFVYIILFLVLVLGAFVIFIFKSRKKIFDKELEKAQLENKFQQEAIISILNTQEAERTRIAQDLHDEISSKINIIFFQSNMLLSNKVKQEDIPEFMQNIADVSQEIQNNARDIAHNLLPPTFEKFGLHQAIIELTKQFSSHDFSIDYINENEEFANIEIKNHIHLFRIIQELINNSIKHGKATEIKIKINKVKMIYNDNGIGIKNNNNKGMGTINILNRAKILNANFTINNKERGIIAVLDFEKT